MPENNKFSVKTGDIFYCMDKDIDALQYAPHWYKCTNVIYEKINSEENYEYHLSKLSDNKDITVRENNGNIILGPFKVASTLSGGKYTYSITTSNNGSIEGTKFYSDVNANHEITDISNKQFYIKVLKDEILNKRILTIKLKAENNITKEITNKYNIIATYTTIGHEESNEDPLDEFQRVKVTGELEKKEKITQKEQPYVEWELEYGNLEIIKQDEDNSNVKLDGVQIKVTGPDFDKTYTTDANGKITIKDLKQGTYTITEVSNPYYGYNVMATGKITVKGGMTNTYTLKNTKQTGNLKIEKKDADSGRYLKGVSFNIKRKDENKYIQVKVGNEWKTKCEGIVHLSNMRFVENEQNATVFTTNEDGIIEIRNILKGTYDVKEISVGDENTEYEIDDNYISWSYTSVANDLNKGAGTGKIATVAVWRRSSLNTKNPPAYENRNEVLIFNNQKKFINLSGYVWVDKQSTKQSYANNLYKTNEHPEINDYEDDQDILLDGITVRLKDKLGSIIKETKTKEKGNYLFEKVEINKLSDYYVEFEYNGLKYQNVTKHLEKDNGSKAEEGINRERFNNSFELVRNGSYINGKQITYNYNYNESEGSYTTVPSNIPGYKIVADTKRVELDILELYNKQKEHMEDNTIKNINLGLYEREQPDISLVKDIKNVKVSINGYNHVYDYASRFKVKQEITEDDWNVGVKYKNSFTGTYGRAIYKSDLDYNDNNPETDNELKVYVTYQIKMVNESTNLTVAVNSILDYYDKNYKITKIGTDLDKYKDPIEEIKVESAEDYKNLYKKTNIIMYNLENDNIDTKKIIIEPQQEKDIYVQFELNSDAIKRILDNKDTLDNVAEIECYTTYCKDENGNFKLYAGIDKDSEPGNAAPEKNKLHESKMYEDDTDSAPGLLLELANARKITGTVFLDNVDSKTAGGSGKERLGDGKYTDGEKTISEVKVGLYKLSDFDKNGNINTGATPIGETTYNEGKNNGTGDDGTFTISNFVPGEYKIVYFWGDSTYSVNDYKGTVYDSSRDQNNKSWYKENVDTRLTDAMDNYETRKRIDADNSTITKMDSITPTVHFGVEIEDIENGLNFTPGIDKVEFIVKNVDFGIVERARQEIDVRKIVKSVEITLANGQTIATYKVNGNGTVEKSNGITYMEPSLGQNNGMIKAEIDSELIQGANVKIQYAITLTNNSELDYDSKKYYLYGDKEGLTEANKIKYVPSGIYDYLDSTLKLEQPEKPEDKKWETKTIEQYNESVSEPTITEDYLYKYYSVSNDSEGNEIEYTGYEFFKEHYQVTEWNMKKIKEARTKRLANKTILYNGDIASKIQEITPGGEPVEFATLTASKVLANTDEINLNNDVEITKVTRTGETGRNVTLTSVYDRAESVVITPPTGENQNYILFISIAISFLVTTGTGIVFIKKKVLG